MFEGVPDDSPLQRALYEALGSQIKAFYLKVSAQRERSESTFRGAQQPMEGGAAMRYTYNHGQEVVRVKVPAEELEQAQRRVSVRVPYDFAVVDFIITPAQATYPSDGSTYPATTSWFAKMRIPNPAALGIPPYWTTFGPKLPGAAADGTWESITFSVEEDPLVHWAYDHQQAPFLPLPRPRIPGTFPAEDPARERRSLLLDLRPFSTYEEIIYDIFAAHDGFGDDLQTEIDPAIYRLYRIARPQPYIGWEGSVNFWPDDSEAPGAQGGGIMYSHSLVRAETRFIDFPPGVGSVSTYAPEWYNNPTLIDPDGGDSYAAFEATYPGVPVQIYGNGTEAQIPTPSVGQRWLGFNVAATHYITDTNTLAGTHINKFEDAGNGLTEVEYHVHYSMTAATYVAVQQFIYTYVPVSPSECTAEARFCMFRGNPEFAISRRSNPVIGPFEYQWEVLPQFPERFQTGLATVEGPVTIPQQDANFSYDPSINYGMQRVGTLHVYPYGGSVLFRPAGA